MWRGKCQLINSWATNKRFQHQSKKRINKAEIQSLRRITTGEIGHLVPIDSIPIRRFGLGVAVAIPRELELVVFWVGRTLFSLGHITRPGCLQSSCLVARRLLPVLLANLSVRAAMNLQNNPFRAVLCLLVLTQTGWAGVYVPRSASGCPLRHIWRRPWSVLVVVLVWSIEVSPVWYSGSARRGLICHGSPAMRRRSGRLFMGGIPWDNISVVRRIGGHVVLSIFLDWNVLAPLLCQYRHKGMQDVQFAPAIVCRGGGRRGGGRVSIPVASRWACASEPER